MTQRGSAPFDPLAAVTLPALDTPLAMIMAERIAQSGPITFAEWMDACLYDPEHGYYRRGRPTVGRNGDFLTSPEVHPLFGASVAHVISELWSGEPLTVVEVGPGSGAMAESILRHLHATAADLAAELSYALVEPDPSAAEQTRARLSHAHDARLLQFYSDITEIPSADLVVANELLDALPVHRLVARAGAWREIYVDYSRALGFHDCELHVSDASLLDPLMGVEASERQIAEVSPVRAEIVEALARAVCDGGLLLLFDYGYERARLYASWRRDGTLMTFRKHVPGDDPYVSPGETDITCHVDINQVREAADAAGLTALPTRSQAEWLHDLGAAVLPAVADAGADKSRYLAARRAAETLADPAGLGRVAVMAFVRGDTPPLSGWRGHA